MDEKNNNISVWLSTAILIATHVVFFVTGAWWGIKETPNSKLIERVPTPYAVYSVPENQDVLNKYRTYFEEMTSYTGVYPIPSNNEYVLSITPRSDYTIGDYGKKSTFVASIVSTVTHEVILEDIYAQMLAQGIEYRAYPGARIGEVNVFSFPPGSSQIFFGGEGYEGEANELIAYNIKSKEFSILFSDAQLLYIEEDTINSDRTKILSVLDPEKGQELSVLSLMDNSITPVLILNDPSVSLISGCGMGCHHDFKWIDNTTIEYTTYSIPSSLDEEVKENAPQRLHVSLK